MVARKRGNGEGSIYPYRTGGFAAYVWVTKPDGKRARKYVYGKDREETHTKWLDLHRQANEGPVATRVPTVASYNAYWLAEIVEPNLAPGTYVTYEALSRRYIVPGLGKRRMDKLQNSEVQTWLNKIRKECQCCAQKKDAGRQPARQRCCALGKCCNDFPSANTVIHVRRVLRTMLNHAITDRKITQNAAKSVKLPSYRQKKRKAWTSDEARQFLESARADGDPYYAAYVLVLVLGLRKGEMMGTTWDRIDLDGGEIMVDVQLQRVGNQLLHRETKTPTSDDALPFPEVCTVALRERRTAQQAAKKKAGDAWHENGLVFTTRYGTPIEPRNFNRYWDRRCGLAGVRRITIRDARRTCASLLADLDVHPRVAMQILRHAQFSITMEIYTVVSSATTRAALKKLGESLDH